MKNYLRFTPDEFRSIWSACRPIPLKGGSFVLFRYFLLETLQATAPDLARRLAALSWGKLRVLREYLRRKREKLSRKG